MTTKPRTLCGSLIALGLLAAIGVAAAQPLRVDVSVATARLSVSAHGVALEQILVEISRQTGLDIKLETGLVRRFAEEVLTVEFTDHTIEESLRRLLGPRNSILLYDARGLTEARIYVEGTGEFRPLAVPPRAGVTQPPPARPREMTAEERERVLQRERAGRTATRKMRLPEHGEAAPRADEAVQAEARAREQEALKTALEALARERDPEVLETAMAELLGHASVSLEPLLRFAEAQQYPDLSIQALELLAEHGATDARVSDLLTRLSRESGNEDIRDAAATILDDLRAGPSAATGHSDVEPRPTRLSARPAEQPGIQPR